jgi:hypothetical protein
LTIENPGGSSPAPGSKGSTSNGRLPKATRKAALLEKAPSRRANGEEKARVRKVSSAPPNQERSRRQRIIF